MEKVIYNEKNGLWYELQGDYYIPCLKLPEEKQQHIGIWGQRHLRYIKQNRKVLYLNLLTSGKLNGYLADLDKQAEEMFSRLVKQMAERECVTEKLKVIERIYEDNVLGKISDERFYRMSANYENEQKELLAAVEHDEQSVRKAEQEKVDLKVFLEAIRECTDLKELTPTIVNTLIKRIEVHNSVKDENGVKHVPIDISFTAVGIINIPTEKELIAAMEEIREKPLKTA